MSTRSVGELTSVLQDSVLQKRKKTKKNMIHYVGSGNGRRHCCFKGVMNAHDLLLSNHISGQIKGTIEPYSLFQNDHVACFEVSSLRALTTNISFKG